MRPAPPLPRGQWLSVVILAAVIPGLSACSQPTRVTASQPPAPAPTQVPAASPPSSSTPSDVQVTFDTGSSALSAEANQKLDGAARLYREGHPVVMFIAGHADSTGSEYPNLLLSAERARAVKQALVERGIPADRLELEALGTSLPANPNEVTPENNRRVVITWR
jgi:outer membrane protein OmpA-like peptidoglycan-associated protein